MKSRESVERSHKALLMMATVSVKVFLMAIASTSVFCGSADPRVLFLQCYNNIPYVGASIGAIAIMGIVFGYYIIRIKAFDSIFGKMIKADFLVTAMYFAATFYSPHVFDTKVMIWLFGMWILGMLMAPFNKEKTLFKKITQYGSLIALGGILSAHLLPTVQEIHPSFTVGLIISSILSVFGSGHES